VPESFEIRSIELPDDSEVHALLRACPDVEGVRFANDEFIVHGEDTAMDIFLLLRGNCLVEQPDAPRERTPGSELAVIQADPETPVFVGEMAYLGGGYRTASVRSVMATHALRLQPAHLDTIIAELPGMTRVLCRQFAERLGEANAFIRVFQEMSAMDASQQFLGPGETLVNAGAPVETLYQIIDGALEVQGGGGRSLAPGNEGPVFVHPGEFFAEGVHPQTLVTTSQCIVLGLGASSKAAIIRNFPELALGLLDVRGHMSC
jgi:CRP-like cAMP-binding protein